LQPAPALGLLQLLRFIEVQVIELLSPKAARHIGDAPLRGDVLDALAGVLVPRAAEGDSRV
jgi:hypothetical protein